MYPIFTFSVLQRFSRIAAMKEVKKLGGNVMNSSLPSSCPEVHVI